MIRKKIIKNKTAKLLFKKNQTKYKVYYNLFKKMMIF
jgi:hypothetical protein